MSIQSTLSLSQDHFESNASSQVLNAVTESMIGLRTALEDQIESKKNEKEEKKDNWGKLLDHPKNMILNVSSIDRKSRSPALGGYLLEVMNQSSLAESRRKSNVIMKW